MSGPLRPVFRPCVLCRAEKRERAGDGFFQVGWPGAARDVPADLRGKVLVVCSEHFEAATERVQKARAARFAA